MEHLSIEEMIMYVTANKVDENTLELMSRVNAHIRTCSACEEQVSSYQRVYDEMLKAALSSKELTDRVTAIIKNSKASTEL